MKKMIAMNPTTQTAERNEWISISRRFSCLVAPYTKLITTISGMEYQIRGVMLAINVGSALSRITDVIMETDTLD